MLSQLGLCRRGNIYDNNNYKYFSVIMCQLREDGTQYQYWANASIVNCFVSQSQTMDSSQLSRDFMLLSDRLTIEVGQYQTCFSFHNSSASAYLDILALIYLQKMRCCRRPLSVGTLACSPMAVSSDKNVFDWHS